MYYVNQMDHVHTGCNTAWAQNTSGVAFPLAGSDIGDTTLVFLRAHTPSDSFTPLVSQFSLSSQRDWATRAVRLAAAGFQYPFELGLLCAALQPDVRGKLSPFAGDRIEEKTRDLQLSIFIIRRR